MKKRDHNKKRRYEEVMNALAIIQANIIPTRYYEIQQQVKIVLQEIEKNYPHGARGPIPNLTKKQSATAS